MTIPPGPEEKKEPPDQDGNEFFRLMAMFFLGISLGVVGTLFYLEWVF